MRVCLEEQAIHLSCCHKQYPPFRVEDSGEEFSAVVLKTPGM
jgi:hypothetical protein